MIKTQLEYDLLQFQNDGKTLSNSSFLTIIGIFLHDSSK